MTGVVSGKRLVSLSERSRSISYVLKTDEYIKKIPSFELMVEGQKCGVDYSTFVRYLIGENYAGLCQLHHAGYIIEEHVGGALGRSLMEFEFDLKSFEEEWFGNIFCGERTLDPSDLIGIMYDAFIRCWKNKKILTDQIQYSGIMAHNGLQIISDLIKFSENSKIIIVSRDYIGRTYSNAKRIKMRYGIKSRNSFFSSIYYDPFSELLYSRSFLKRAKEFDSLIKSDFVKNDKNTIVVDFNEMVTKPELMMRRIAEFLEIEFEEILCRATFNGIDLEKEETRHTGKVMDNPYEKLNKSQIDLLQYLFSGRDAGKSLLIDLLLSMRGVKWKIIQAAVQFRKNFRAISNTLKSNK